MLVRTVLFAFLILAGTFSAPVVPASASEAVKISASSKWRGKTIILAAEFFRPDRNGKVPVVILMHGCGGMHASVRGSLNAHARHLTGNGFAALVLDSFGPRRIGGGWVCGTTGRLAAARFYRQTDANDAARWLQAQPGIDDRNIFLMGQSNGGSTAIIAAMNSTVFRAVAAFYPWCGAFMSSRAPKTPLIVFGGALDDWVSPQGCRVRARSKRYDYVEYGTVAHSFDVQSGLTSYRGHRVGYNATATADSRNRMVRFFRKHLR